MAITGAGDVSVTSTARLLLEGRAGVSIRGATVDVAAAGQVAVTGALIKLN